MDKPTAEAFKAFRHGEASSSQQRKVATYILQITEVLSFPSVSATADERAFSAGKRAVGIVVMEAMGLTLLDVTEDKDG